MARKLYRKEVGPLAKGTRVRVYQKPLTQEDFEGEAVIITVGTSHMHYYEVQFVDDDYSNPVWRWIYPESEVVDHVSK